MKNSFPGICLLLIGSLCMLQYAIAQNVGIGTTTPFAPLQFANNTANRKIVLYQTLNNDHQYYGFGINGGVLRYQTDATAADHVFYSALQSNASQELMRIKGNGLVGIGTAPSVRLDIAGTDGWDLINGEGDVRIGNANTRIKIGIALGGGGIGAAGIMQAGGIGNLQLGAANKFLLELSGASNFINLKGLSGGLRIDGSSGTSMQLLSSNGAAASPQWRSLSDVIAPLTDYVAAGQDYFLNDNNLRTYGPLNFTMPANARLLLWSKVSTFKSCTIGPCHSAWIAKVYIDGTLVDTYEIQGTSWAQQYSDNKSVGPTILSVTPGAHALTFTVQNKFGNPVAAVYPQLIMLPN